MQLKKTIGFFGAGNMARAIITGLIHSKLYQAEEILVHNHRYQPTLEKLVTDLAVTPVSNREDLLQQADIVILAVKPHLIEELLSDIKASISEQQIILSIAAGITIDQMTAIIGTQRKIARVMPNTPSLIGEGVSAVTVNQQFNSAETNLVLSICQSFGHAEMVPEHLFDAVVGVSGSAPAYVYLFIEALADGAVLKGMPRQQAYNFAAQTVLGAAKMVLTTDYHPGELKDMVTSPGGTTIAAVKELEDRQLRSAVINAVKVAADKNHEMSQT
ncbi:MAG: pyrroline-5-carboxylate reductase [Enterococcus sp.]